MRLNIRAPASRRPRALGMARVRLQVVVSHWLRGRYAVLMPYGVTLWRILGDKLLETLARPTGIETEARALDDAIDEARRRLEQARQREAQKADQQNAAALRQELKAFIACGQEIDQALITLAETSVKMREILASIE